MSVYLTASMGFFCELFEYDFETKEEVAIQTFALHGSTFTDLDKLKTEIVSATVHFRASWYTKQVIPFLFKLWTILMPM